MTGTLLDIENDISLYTTYGDNTDFVSEYPRFVQAAEERIFYLAQLPMNRAAETGNMTAGNPYLQLPAGFLAPSSLSIINEPTIDEPFLLNKDVEYIRQVFPDPTATGVPFCYALFDTDGSGNATVIVIGPTPDQNYSVQLNYFCKPPSLTQSPYDVNGTWLSLNAYDTLLYGALSEASNWMKKVQGIDNMGDTYEQRFLVGLQGLKNLGEARDRKDTYRGGEMRKAES